MQSPSWQPAKCGKMSDLVICKFRKCMVIHDTQCPHWDQVSLKGRIVQPPKTGLKCTSAAAPTLQQTVACQSCPLNNTNTNPSVTNITQKVNRFHNSLAVIQGTIKVKEISLYYHFWNLSWDIQRLPWQPPSNTWIYVSAHYDTGGTRTCDSVHWPDSCRRATHCATEADNWLNIGWVDAYMQSAELKGLSEL